MHTEGAPQQSTLFRLPPELLLHISAQAGLVDRVCFALSCKHLLAVSRLGPLETPDPSSHRAPWSADPFWQYTDLDSLEPECICGRMEVLLRRVQPLNQRGRADRTLQLCVDCMKYLPRRRRFWHARARELRNADWDDEVEGDWKLAMSYFGAAIKMQCPQCRLQEHGNIINRDRVHGLTPAELASLAGRV